MSVVLQVASFLFFCDLPILGVMSHRSKAEQAKQHAKDKAKEKSEREKKRKAELLEV